MSAFHEWLQDHRHGAATDEWADELATVLEAVKLTGKPGKLTITLHVEPKGRTVVVTDDVAAKTPRPDREAAIYFVDDNWSLVREDPNQGRLPGTVPEGVSRLAERRDVDSSTGEISGRNA